MSGRMATFRDALGELLVATADESRERAIHAAGGWNQRRLELAERRKQRLRDDFERRFSPGENKS